VSAAEPVSRVRRTDDLGDSGVVVECAPCGLVLRQVDAFDHDVALGTFFSHHPASPDAIHQQDVPAGWSSVTSPTA
jgi:hypothetical protein